MKIVPMGKDFILYRCLHAGLLSSSNIEEKSRNISSLPRDQLERNKAFLRRLIETYGSCAMLAMDGEYAVGYVRFYPDAIYKHSGRKHICCQDPASSITRDMVEMEMPRVEDLDDPILSISCWFIHADYRNRGLSHLILQHIVGWANERGWKTIRSSAAADNFWVALQACTPMLQTYEKHGFRKIRTDPSPDLEEFLIHVRQGKFGEERQRRFEKYCGKRDLSEIAIYHTVECRLR